MMVVFEVIDRETHIAIYISWSGRLFNQIEAAVVRFSDYRER
jgi:hypothetical protein